MSDYESRPFQAGDKVSVSGREGVVNQVSMVLVDFGLSNGWEREGMVCAPSDVTLVEPVKQWRPLPEGVSDGDGYLYYNGWAVDTEAKSLDVEQQLRRELGNLDRKMTQLRADLDLAMEVADFWSDFEETQGMEQ